MSVLSAGDITTITSYPQYTGKFLSICPRTVLFAGQLDANPTLDAVSGGIISFTADGTSGVAADCIPGMTIDFGTTVNGNDLGHGRLRKTTDGVTIEMNETAFADVAIVDNSYFSIREEFRPWIKMLRLVKSTTGNSRFPNSFVEYHDYDIAYVDQNDKIPPCINITRSATEDFPPKYAGFLDVGQSYRTVVLSSALSEFLMSAETRTSTLWDVGDGTITVGSTTTETITVQFPEAHRYISCTIVGSAGGSQIMYIPIHAHGDTYLPFSTALRGFEVSDDETIDPGRKVRLRIMGQENKALESDIPEGAPYIFWENKVTFNGTAAPSQYRDQMYGWSFSRQPSTQINDPVEIEIGGIGHWMNSLQGFSIQIEDVGKTANKHFYMEDMNVDKVIHYILREFTTVPNLVNIFLSEVDTVTVNEKINKGTIFTQLDQFVKSFKCDLRFDTSGALWIRENINYMDEGEEFRVGEFYDDERALVDDIMTIDDSMVLEDGFKIKFLAIEPMGRVDAVGSWNKGAKKEPGIVASRAPGKVTGQSSASESTPFIRLEPPEDDAIIELNYVSGRYYIKRVDMYQQFEIKLAGYMDVFEPAWGETINLDLSPSNAGGLSLDVTDRYTIDKIRIAHSNNIGKPRKQITLTVSRVTNGQPGINIPIENIDWLSNPFFDLFYEVSSVIPPPDNSPLVEELNGELIGFGVVGEADSDGIARTFTFDRFVPAWEDITPPTVPGTRTLSMVDGRLDDAVVPFKALYYEGTTYEIYDTVDVLADIVIWTLEESGTLAGTNPRPPILVADKEASTWAVAWLSEDGVRITRKTTGSWTSIEFIGSSSFTSTVTDIFLGMAIRNGIVMICGVTGNNEYKLYHAIGTGSFSVVESTLFSRAINSIRLDNQGSAYVSSFTDSTVITPAFSIWDFLTSNHLINEIPNSAIVSGNSWFFDDAGFVDGAQLTAEWFFDGTLSTDISWELNIVPGNHFYTSYQGTTAPSPSGNFRVNYTIDVWTQNIGEYQFTGQVKMEQAADGNGSDFVTSGPGPQYFYVVTALEDSVFIIDILSSMPSNAEITYIKIDLVVDGTPPNFIRTFDWELQLGNPIFDFDDVDVGTSKFYRVDTYSATPVWNDITPFSGNIPYQFNSITLDTKDETFLSFHGVTITSNKLWIFLSQRGAVVSETSTLAYDWSKRAGVIILAGGGGNLDFSIDRLVGLDDRLGDLESVLGITGPDILNALVLFGG